MKSKILKNTCSIVCFALSMMMVIPQVNAMSITYSVSHISQNNTPSISMRSEVKGYKYKILNGKQWKRLWSYTYAKWIDPKWTLA